MDISDDSESEWESAGPCSEADTDSDIASDDNVDSDLEVPVKPR